MKKLNKFMFRTILIFSISFLVLVSCIFIFCSYTAPDHSNNLKVIDELFIPYQSSVKIFDGHEFLGSGTIVHSKKNFPLLILSAYHVISEVSDGIFISVPYDTVKRKAHIVKEDKNQDLIILETESKETVARTYAKISPSSPRIGEHIWAIGNPGGEDRILTDGIISGMYSNIVATEDDIVEKNFYRLTTPIFKGSSGGGVFNSKGQLIGVIRSVGVVSSNIYETVGSDEPEIIPGLFCSIPEPGSFYAIPLEQIRQMIFRR